jgi:chromosome partitioning protein
MTIIAFISQKGGVGKSTLSQALAREAQQKKIKTLLADCDIQQATSHQWSKIEKKVNCKLFNSVKEVWPLTNKYDLIIIDGPARTSQATQEIAEKADLVIQPTGASRADLVPAVKEFNALKGAGIPRKKLLLVLTRFGSQAEIKAVRQYLTESKYAFCQTCLLEKVSYRQAQNEGKTIAEVAYPKLAQQAKELIKEILKYL